MVPPGLLHKPSIDCKRSDGTWQMEFRMADLLGHRQGAARFEHPCTLADECRQIRCLAEHLSKKDQIKGAIW
jgi:ADP-ribosylglycohydrolase